MDMLSFSLNGVAPIFLTMLTGLLLRRLGLLEKDTAEKLNKLCYTVLIPCKLFIQLYNADLSAVADVPLLLFSLLFTAGLILLLCLTVPRFVPAGAKQGEFIQGVFRGNTAILGVSLVTNLYGEAATAALALPLPLMLILYNTVAPVILTLYAGGSRPTVKQLLRKVATNPFLIGVLFGLIVSLLKIRLPGFLAGTVNSIGSTGSTLALIALGAVTEPDGLRSSGKMALAASLLRLIAVPAVSLGLAVLFGFRHVQLAVLVSFFATPTAVGSYVLARNVDGDGELAKQILILTTVIAVPTMFLTLVLLRGIGVM